MANREATKFVKNLVAAFHRFPVGREALDLMIEKLSARRLSEKEWGKVFDQILTARSESERTPQGLPELPEIYAAIRAVSTAELQARQTGLIVWEDEAGRTWFVAGVIKNNQWVTQKENRRMENGLNVRNVRVEHGIPGPLDPERVATPEEVAQLSAGIKANLRKAARSI